MSAASLKITAKGQITLKQALMRHLGVQPGDRVDVVFGPQGVVQLRTQAITRPDISAAFGLLHRPDQRAMTVKEMDEAIGKAVAEEDRRTLSDR